MRTNSNARNAIPSQSLSFKREHPITRCQGESLRDSEMLWEVLLCACAHQSVNRLIILNTYNANVNANADTNTNTNINTAYCGRRVARDSLPELLALAICCCCVKCSVLLYCYRVCVLHYVVYAMCFALFRRWFDVVDLCIWHVICLPKLLVGCNII